MLVDPWRRSTTQMPWWRFNSKAGFQLGDHELVDPMRSARSVRLIQGPKLFAAYPRSRKCADRQCRLRQLRSSPP